MLQDTSPEFEKMWHKKWLQKSPQERVQFAFSMFSDTRRIILASMPADLSATDQKRFIYKRTYGESLPDDFPLK